MTKINLTGLLTIAAIAGTGFAAQAGAISAPFERVTSQIGSPEARSGGSYLLAQADLGDAASSAAEEVSDADTMAEDAFAEQEAPGSAEAKAEDEISDEEDALVKEVMGDSTGSDALTLDGFDLGAATSMIDASDLPEAQKASLKTAVEKAKENPELVDTTLQQVRSALGN